MFRLSRSYVAVVAICLLALSCPAFAQRGTSLTSLSASSSTSQGGGGNHTSSTYIGGSVNGYVPQFDAGPLLTEAAGYISGIVTGWLLPIGGILLAFSLFALVAGQIVGRMRRCRAWIADNDAEGSGANFWNFDR